MEETLKEILGFEVVETNMYTNNNLEILENTALYNKEMTVSVELLTDGKTLYVTVFKDDTWYFEGYYREYTTF